MRDAELIGFWQEGQRRLADIEPRDRTLVERVVDELVFELRRKLGGQFTVRELMQLYLDKGTDWCFQVAIRVAPDTPAAWDMTTVGGAAFARYVREAVDFRRVREPEEA